MPSFAVTRVGHEQLKPSHCLPLPRAHVSNLVARLRQRSNSSSENSTRSQRRLITNLQFLVSKCFPHALCDLFQFSSRILSTSYSSHLTHIKAETKGWKMFYKSGNVLGKTQRAYSLRITFQLSEVIIPDVQTPHTPAQRLSADVFSKKGYKIYS